MNFKTFVEQTEKKSRRKLDVGDWVYIEPFITNSANTTKIAKAKAGQIGRCVKRTPYAQYLVYQIKFDDGKEINITSSFARKVTEKDYNELKAGKLKMPSKQEVIENEQKVLRDNLFDQLRKLNLQVSVNFDGTRQCNFESKYSSNEVFYIKEEADTNNKINVVTKVPSSYVETYITSNAYIYFNITDFVYKAVTSNHLRLNIGSVKLLVNTIKKYLKSNYKPGINKLNNTNVELDDNYNLISILGEINAYTKGVAYFKDGKLHKEDGPAYIDNNKSVYALNGHVFDDKHQFDEYKAKQEFLKKVNNSANNIFDKDFIGEIT